MKNFIKLTELGNTFLINKSAIVSVDENLDSGQRAVRVNVGGKTEIHLTDNTLEEIIERLGE